MSDLRGKPRPKYAYTAEEFWSKIDRQSDGCWPWLGRVSGGYGRVYWPIEGKFRDRRAPQIAWLLSGRSLGRGRYGSQLHHRCRNKLCCNPGHIFQARAGSGRTKVLTPEAFWGNVACGAADACWPWKAGHHQHGYGNVWWFDGFRRRGMKATHVALELDGRPLPFKGAVAMHSCDYPPCCNPGHLTWGTPALNAADMVAKGRHWTRRRTEREA